MYVFCKQGHEYVLSTKNSLNWLQSVVFKRVYTVKTVVKDHLPLQEPTAYSMPSFHTYKLTTASYEY